MSRYKKILVKLSGQALAGGSDFGLDSDALNKIAHEILSVRSLGVQVAIVVGGGNIFRGSVAAEWGIDRAEADNIGMLGTVINSLMMRGVLTARGDFEVRAMTALPMESIAEPYIRLRAIHHLNKGYIVILACGIGQPYVTTDYTGVQRALELDADAILFAKHGVDGVYDADPRKNPNAKKLEEIDYDTVIKKDLRVMDPSAFILAKDHELPIHVFDFEKPDLMRRICEGENLGTTIQSSKA
jgi:uridylate kinase